MLSERLWMLFFWPNLASNFLSVKLRIWGVFFWCHCREFSLMFCWLEIQNGLVIFNIQWNLVSNNLWYLVNCLLLIKYKGFFPKSFKSLTIGIFQCIPMFHVNRIVDDWRGTALTHLQSELAAGLWWATCVEEVLPRSELTELWGWNSTNIHVYRIHWCCM